MGSKIHKFQEKIELTYEQYFHICFDEVIRLSVEFEKALGRDKAFEVIGRAREKADLDIIGKQMKERPPIESFEDFKAFMKELHESPFSSHLFTITYKEDVPNEIEFHTTECILAKVFREMNAADLGYAMCCRPDFATTPAYNPHVRLRRIKTLMQGDNYCDTAYCWVNKTNE